MTAPTVADTAEGQVAPTAAAAAEGQVASAASSSTSTTGAAPAPPDLRCQWFLFNGMKSVFGNGIIATALAEVRCGLWSGPRAWCGAVRGSITAVLD